MLSLDLLRNALHLDSNPVIIATCGQSNLLRGEYMRVHKGNYGFPWPSVRTGSADFLHRNRKLTKTGRIWFHLRCWVLHLDLSVQSSSDSSGWKWKQRNSAQHAHHRPSAPRSIQTTSNHQLSTRRRKIRNRKDSTISRLPQLREIVRWLQKGLGMGMEPA